LLALEGKLRDAGFQSERDSATIKELTGTQLELKVLIDQERELYNDEREKMEEDMAKVARLAEAKVRLLRNKLLGLYDGDFDVGRELPLEEIVDRIGIRLANAKRVEFIQ
jgi:hypothetical protein